MNERFISFLRRTPCHPQWLVFRGSRKRLASELEHVAGLVLDVGCADSWPRTYIRKPHEYVGIEYPATSVRYGFRPSVYANAEHLPFYDASFNWILAFDVLEHIPHFQQTLRELARTLKPGGHALIQIPFAYPLHDEPYDFNRLTLHGLKSNALEAGFEISEIEPMGHPLETACANAAIACAISVRSLLFGERHGRGLRLAAAIFTIIPFGALMLAFNVLGRVAALFPSSSAFPIRYVMKVRKPL